HRPEGLPPSDVLAHGSVSRRGEEWVLDLQAAGMPLSLTARAAHNPGLPLSGDLRGALRARGPPTARTIPTDLESEARRVAGPARIDATGPTERYAVEGEVSEFAVSRLVTTLPEPTRISGYVDGEGRGADPATMTLD